MQKNTIRLTFYLSLIIVVIKASSFSGSLQAQEYTCLNFNTAQGLAHSYIYTIVQDKNAYLWIGTADGLSRFDGKTFKNFRQKDSLGGNFISCSYKMEDGILFGHSNGNISLYNYDKFIKYSTRQFKGSITQIKSDKSGNIWAASQNEGLLLISKNKNTELNYTFSDPISITSFDFLESFQLVIGAVDGLYKSSINKGNQLLSLDKVSSIPDDKIQRIIKKKDAQSLYILTENEGIFILESNNGELKVETLKVDWKYAPEACQSMCEDQDGNLWVASLGSGLIKLKKDESAKEFKASYYNELGGFPSNNLKTVFEDREGNIWIGSYGSGLFRLIEGAYSFFNFQEDVLDNNVKSIITVNNYIWLAVENSVVKFDKTSRNILKVYSVKNGLPDDNVTSLFKQNNKKIWIGTAKEGVYVLNTENDSIKKVFISEGNLENSINNINGNDSTIGISTKKGACIISLNKSEIRWYDISSGGLPNNYVNQIFFDSFNRVFISTKGNILTLIKEGKSERIQLASEKLITDIVAATEDENNNIWIATKGNGVYIYSNDSVFNLSSQEGLFSDYCYSIHTDNKGFVWLSHRGALSKLNIRTSHAKPLSSNVGITPNMEFNINSGYKDEFGNIYFGSNTGFLIYKPEKDKINIHPPLLKIISVKANGEFIDFDKKISLKPNKYNLRIDYMGISLSDPDQVKYSHKLEGLESEWSNESFQNFATYNNILHGKYSFLLKAINEDGVTADSVLRIDFTIKKPIWMKWWFYASIVLTIAFSTIFYVKKRESKLRQRNIILEKKVVERTRALQLQKEKIQKQNDTLEIQSKEIEFINKSLTASIRYASQIQQAVIPPIDALEELNFESFIINKPKDIVSGDFYWVTRTKNKLIAIVADCTGHGVPGAFMSMLGIALLNEIIISMGVLVADQILELLREKIINALARTKNLVSDNDGMDISLCVFDTDSDEVQFAGAYNDLIMIRNNEIEIIKADRIPIGQFHGGIKSFTMKRFKIMKNDRIYLCTDGYIDQFGGGNNKKFTKRRLYEALIENHKLPIKEEKLNLEARIEQWKGDCDQLDDITMLGIRI